jgi:hypothetical protein
LPQSEKTPPAYSERQTCFVPASYFQYSAYFEP